MVQTVQGKITLQAQPLSILSWSHVLLIQTLLKRFVLKPTYLARAGSCCTATSGDTLSDVVVLVGDKCHSKDGQISVKTTSSSVTPGGQPCFSLCCCCWFCAVGCFFKRSGLKDCKVSKWWAQVFRAITDLCHYSTNYHWSLFGDIPFAFLPPTGNEGEMGNSASSALEKLAWKDSALWTKVHFFF